MTDSVTEEFYQPQRSRIRPDHIIEDRVDLEQHYDEARHQRRKTRELLHHYCEVLTAMLVCYLCDFLVVGTRQREDDLS